MHKLIIALGKYHGEYFHDKKPMRNSSMIFSLMVRCRSSVN